MAKGFRKNKSKAQGLFLGFKPVLLGWTGKGELPILTGIEHQGYFPSLGTLHSNCGFYVNELLLKLLHRHDSHEQLYDRYHDLMTGLSQAEEPSTLLRYFEKHLLQETGFGLILDHDADTGEAISPDARYQYLLHSGPTRVDSGEKGDISGQTLIGLHRENLLADAHLREAQWLTRAALDIQLGGRELKSRRIFREMKRYQSMT